MLADHSSSARTRAVGAAMRHTRKRLCSRLRQLAEADDTHFVNSWSILVAEVEAGFRQEESIMEALGYRGLRPHRADNALTLCALHRITPLVESGQTGIGRQALAALVDILSLHRFTADLALASELARPNASSGHLSGHGAGHGAGHLSGHSAGHSAGRTSGHFMPKSLRRARAGTEVGPGPRQPRR